jgi:hypothetical protein
MKCGYGLKSSNALVMNELSSKACDAWLNRWREPREEDGNGEGART